MSYCIWRLFITYGFLNFSYWMALSRGKPFEWNEIRQSQIGHSSTGFYNKKCNIFNICWDYGRSTICVVNSWKIMRMYEHFHVNSEDGIHVNSPMVINSQPDTTRVKRSLQLSINYWSHSMEPTTFYKTQHRIGIYRNTTEQHKVTMRLSIKDLWIVQYRKLLM